MSEIEIFESKDIISNDNRHIAKHLRHFSKQHFEIWINDKLIFEQ